MQTPYPYNRNRHLSFLVRTKKDWLTARDPAMTKLICVRLQIALEDAKMEIPPRQAKIASLCWALEGEMNALQAN